MKIIICGPTGSGKSTLAGQLSDLLIAQTGRYVSIIEAGAWIRQTVIRGTSETVQDHTTRMGREAVRRLQQNPRAALEVIEDQLLREPHINIIVGVRSPVDLAALVVPSADIILQVVAYDQELGRSSEFEHYGLKAIRSMVEWWGISGIVKDAQLVSRWARTDLSPAERDALLQAVK